MAMHWKPLVVVALATLLVSLAPARAEVRHAEAAGFEIGDTLVIDATPAVVWSRLVKPDDWWSAEHRWFDSGRLSLELRPGGCWCEVGPDGAGAQHMTVGYLKPDKALTLLGGLGPLQALGLSGAWQLTLSAEGEGTRLAWTYVVSGYRAEGIAFLAAPVDGVLTEQIARLKAAAEA